MPSRKGKRLMGFKFRQIDVPHRINEKQKKMCMSSKYKNFLRIFRCGKRRKCSCVNI